MAERFTLGQYAKELSDANVEKGELEDELHAVRLKAAGLEAECESRISEVRLEASIKDAQYKNLRTLAERDSQEISRAVRVEDCSIQKMELGSETPHVHFQFTIFNAALYPIGLETKVGGFIRYGNRRLTGELAMSAKWPVGNCQRHYIMRFEIQQWLTKEEAEFIAGDLSRPEDRFFDFEQMAVTVRGGSGVTVIEPKPLRFEKFRGIDKDGRLH
ncbi:MAG: hypothetical protein LC795_03760 [Acidobacteria bacterium]|nr:hypothetical protein [Acidobacteriota bacterium]